MSGHVAGRVVAEAMLRAVGVLRQDELPVKVVDGEMAPVAEGVFECFGAKIAISEGFGALAYVDFIKGKHEKGIWLYRKDAEPVPGGLTFA